MEKICGIYKITNPKGKVYIGQSIDIEKRNLINQILSTIVCASMNKSIEI